MRCNSRLPAPMNTDSFNSETNQNGVINGLHRLIRQFSEAMHQSLSIYRSYMVEGYDAVIVQSSFTCMQKDLKRESAFSVDVIAATMVIGDTLLPTSFWIIKAGLVF